jgi:hypothetical protein
VLSRALVFCEEELMCGRCTENSIELCLHTLQKERAVMINSPLYLGEWGVVLTTHALLAPRSQMSGAIPLLPFWASYRAKFTFILVNILIHQLLNKNMAIC